MNIYVFGNTLLPEDTGAVEMIPFLRKQFPEINFIHADPTGNWWKGYKGLTIIDTVQGIKKVTIFTSLDGIEETQSLTVHDYDLYIDLKLMIKLGKIESFRIIGIAEKSKFDELVRVIEGMKKDEKM